MAHMGQRSRRFALAAGLAAWLSVAARAQQPAAGKSTTVILQTSLGEIHIALDTTRAPLTSRNFLQYVDAGRYDGTSFYRAMQAGDGGRDGLVQAGLQGETRNAFAPVPLEPTFETGLSHVDGAVSMARGSGPNSARAEFFIVVGDMTVAYDGVPDGGDPGYAVFGRVTRGMDIVRRMLRMPRAQQARNPRMQGQMLAEPVSITTARRAP